MSTDNQAVPSNGWGDTDMPQVPPTTEADKEAAATVNGVANLGTVGVELAAALKKGSVLDNGYQPPQPVILPRT
jgi:hypothetical protein